jgi:DNA-binding MarR family transcriptional regulator
LTDEGRQLWARLKQRGDQTIDDAMRDLSTDERAQLLSLMTRVRDSLITP